MVVAVMVFVLALLGYNEIYIHDAFTIPIKDSISTDPTFAHLDTILINTPTHPYFMNKVLYNEYDNSLTITFNGTYVDASGRYKFFEYENNYAINSSFVFGCLEESDITYLAFYKYLGH